MTQTHIFGELDIDLSKSFNQIFTKVFDIGESCGYYATKTKNKIHVSGGDNYAAQIIFDDEGKVLHVKRAQFQDNGVILVDWHTVEIGSYIPI